MDLRFPLPVRAASINELKGRHWAVSMRALRPWREAVGWAWKITPEAERAKVRGRRCAVIVTIPFDVTEKQWSGRRRDPANYVDTICKAIVDQLVEQGVWEDDTPEWVTVAEPRLVRGDEVVVTLLPEAA